MGRRDIVIIILIIPSFDHRFGWSDVPFYYYCGDILVALGFFLIFLVFRENPFAAVTIQVFADQKVITTGPYSKEYRQKVCYKLVPLLW